MTFLWGVFTEMSQIVTILNLSNESESWVPNNVIPITLCIIQSLNQVQSNFLIELPEKMEPIGTAWICECALWKFICNVGTHYEADKFVARYGRLSVCIEQPKCVAVGSDEYLNFRCVWRTVIQGWPFKPLMHHNLRLRFKNTANVVTSLLVKSYQNHTRSNKTSEHLYKFLRKVVALFSRFFKQIKWNENS